jgi:hypothetical protein
MYKKTVLLKYHARVTSQISNYVSLGAIQLGFQVNHLDIPPPLPLSP